MPQPIEESQIKSKAVMSWSSGKKKQGIFCIVSFVQRELFQDLCFISMYSVLNTLSEYTDFYISKKITSYTCCLLLKLTEAFSVSLSHFNFTSSFSSNPWNSTPFVSDLKCFYHFLFYHA